MLATRRLCALLFKRAVSEDGKWCGIYLLFEALLTLTLYLTAFKNSQNLNYKIAWTLASLAFMLFFIGFFKLFISLNKTWSSNQYRLLPVKSSQLYFSTLGMEVLAALVTFGLLLVFNLLVFAFLLPNFFEIVVTFVYSKIFWTQGLKVGLTLLDMFVSVIVELTFFWLLSASLAKLIKPQLQELVQWGGFFILFFMFVSLIGKIEDQISTQLFSVRILIFDGAILVLLMWGSIQLLKDHVETKK